MGAPDCSQFSFITEVTSFHWWVAGYLFPEAEAKVARAKRERVRYTLQTKVRATYEENELHIWSEPRRKKSTERAIPRKSFPMFMCNSKRHDRFDHITG